MVAVDIISDVMCPWCYIGKRRIEQALPLVADLDVEITWRPYQLDATIPAGGVDRAEYLAAKFGSLERAREIYRRVEAAGTEVDIPFKVEAIRVTPNTLDAHRLIRWARDDGRQNEMVERLFQLYFLEGANLTDHEVLADAAESVGMDHDEVKRRLADGADVEAVREDVEWAYRVGISGVPSYIIAGRYLVSGAQHPDVIAGAIRRAADEQAGIETAVAAR